MQEFACLLGQPLQLPIARWVGNPESTEIIEATQNDDGCVEEHDMLLTMPSRSQLYTRVRENCFHEFGRHTVVAKSPQTVPNVGIQRIGLDVGMFLDASLSSRSKADTCLPACSCMVNGVRSKGRVPSNGNCTRVGRSKS